MSDIISENNDLSSIDIGTGPDFDGDLAKQVAAIESRYSWDALEMGITKEQAVANLKAANTPEARAKVLEDLKRRAIERAGLDVSTGEIAVAVALVDGDPESTPSWHKLGKLLAGLQTSAAMRKHAVLDWLVEKQPVFLENGDRVPGAFSTVRTDTGAALHAVGSGYVPFQNHEAFALMDAIVGAGLAVYETAGSLHGGKRIWIMARIPKDLRVGKEDIVKPYAMLTNRHGGGAIKILGTTVRPVCDNTVNMAMRGSKDGGLSIRHTKNVAAAVEEAKKKLGLITQYVDTFQAQIDALAAVTLKDHQVTDYLEQLYPTGKRTARPGLRAKAADGAALLDGILSAQQGESEVVRELLAGAEEERSRTHKRNAKILEQILANYHGEKNNLPGIEGTAWSLFNAVSEYVDHQAPVRGKTELAKANSRMNSIFFGAGNDKKQAAFSLALELAAAGGATLSV
jgi:phage/plasmid-like protein (TIGR03299 family)